MRWMPFDLARIASGTVSSASLFASPSVITMATLVASALSPEVARNMTSVVKRMAERGQNKRLYVCAGTHARTQTHTHKMREGGERQTD